MYNVVDRYRVVRVLQKGGCSSGVTLILGIWHDFYPWLRVSYLDLSKVDL